MARETRTVFSRDVIVCPQFKFQTTRYRKRYYPRRSVTGGKNFGPHRKLPSPPSRFRVPIAPDEYAINSKNALRSRQSTGRLGCPVEADQISGNNAQRTFRNPTQATRPPRFFLRTSSDVFSSSEPRRREFRYIRPVYVQRRVRRRGQSANGDAARTWTNTTPFVTFSNHRVGRVGDVAGNATDVSHRARDVVVGDGKRRRDYVTRNSSIAGQFRSSTDLSTEIINRTRRPTNERFRRILVGIVSVRPPNDR